VGVRANRVRQRVGVIAAIGLGSIALAACGSPSAKPHSTSTLPPLPPEVYGIVTLIGGGASAGTGASAERIALTSVPPELLPATKVGTFPDAVAIAPDQKTAYVTSYQSGTVTPINLSNGKAEKPIAVGRGPAGIAITPNGKMAYVTDAGSSPIGDTVTPINLKTDRPGRPITVGEGPQAIAITADGTMAYVTDAGAIVTGQTGAIGDTVTPIDLATNKAMPPITVGNGPVAIAIAGANAYVANSGSESVSPIDLSARTVGAAIAVPGAPQSIAIRGNTAWVALGHTTISPGNSLVPIDLSTDTAGTPVAVGRQPSAVAISGNKAWVVCASSIVPVTLSRQPAAGKPVSIAGGPYALALYLFRPR
jgi:YVTN family beta-propeller protein